ncbi:hypothetical protein KI387_039650, partial [Taxus chinensis]
VRRDRRKEVDVMEVDDTIEPLQVVMPPQMDVVGLPGIGASRSGGAGGSRSRAIDGAGDIGANLQAQIDRLEKK